MGKAILISIIVASVVLPWVGARQRDPRRGMKRTLLSLLLFSAVYMGLLLLAYAPFHVPAFR